MTPAELLDKQDLIKQLQDLAARPALTPRAAELRALAEDLTHDRRLDRWAELDLVHAYVRPESVTTSAGRPTARRDGLLEAALGVLVFIPLLVTWFGLRDAVRAYGELAEENRDEASRPFLQLWQSGFGGHLSALGRFENVALTAVVLIALLVLLSVVHARVRWRADKEETDQEAERERLLASLASVLTRLQMVLAPHRSASPKQFTAELTKAARQLRSVATEAQKNHTMLSATAGSVTSATTSLRDAATLLTTEVPKLSSAADRIETTLRDGQAATAKAGVANTAAARVIADQVKAAGTTVETSLRTLVTVQRELVTRTETVARATEQASQALVSSTGRTTDVVNGMREATERWDAAAAHWRDAAARVESGVRSLAGAPGTNGDALQATRTTGGLGTAVPATDPYGTPETPAYGARPPGPGEHRAAGADPYAPSTPAPYARSASDSYAPSTPDPYTPMAPDPYAPSAPDPHHYDADGGPLPGPRAADPLGEGVGDSGDRGDSGSDRSATADPAAPAPRHASPPDPPPSDAPAPPRPGGGA